MRKKNLTAITVITIVIAITSLVATRKASVIAAQEASIVTTQEASVVATQGANVVTAQTVSASRYKKLLASESGRKKLAALAQVEESRKIVTRIIETLMVDRNPLIRMRCAEVLGQIGDPEGVPYLEHLAEDKNGSVVETAVFSLGLIGDETCLEPLERFLVEGTKGIRIRALEALGRTGIPEAAPLIVPYLKDFHSSIRATAAVALAVLGDSLSAGELENSIHDPNTHVMASVSYAMGRLGFKKSAKRIIELLENEDEEVRMRAAEALGRLKSKKATSRLSTLLSDNDRMVSIKAAEALSRIGDKRSAEALEQVLHFKDTYIKTIALEGLASIGRKNSFEPALPLLKDSSPMVRRAAIKAVASTGGEDARAYLLAIVRNGSIMEKTTALEMLGKISHRDDLPLLLETLSSEKNPLLREGAAAGLGLWKNPKELLEPVASVEQRGTERRPIDVLIEAADGIDWVVASIAAESLGLIGSVEIMPDLTRIFHKHQSRLDSDRKLALLGAVESIASRNDSEDWTTDILTFLRDASKDPDPRVADAACTAAEIFGGAMKPQPSGAWKRGALPWGDPSLPLGEKKIKIITKRGDIDIILFGDDAPNIVKSIVTLVTNGFYNGLTFHRVVPGFVIQGGCPRGDGWGDGGYFLRSQFNLHRYERGIVGMAHSGKDTPGSQIFITQTPQPHLNGRYTVVGKVIRGMDVVDTIEVGDTFSVVVVE